MDFERRRVLALGTATLGMLAGCGSSAPINEETPTDAPTETETGDVNGEGDGGGDGSGGDGGGGATAEVDYGDWFENTSNFDGTTADMTGEDTVTVEVGAPGNDGNFAFSPPAIQISPGTTVRWEWTGEGGAHNVVDTNGAFRSGDPVADGDTTFDRTFDSAGLFTYFCSPHRSLGMKGAVVVGEGDGEGSDDASQEYGWGAATFDSYWYSLYNMNVNVAMSGNGITFPATDAQQETFQQRFPKMLEAAGRSKPPVANANLNMAPFTEGDPRFTQKPVLSGDDGRPDASTLGWDRSASSMTVSPASIAWPHLKGVTWAKNFEGHFDILPDSLAPQFASMLLTTLAQVGVAFALVPQQGGNLRLNEDNLLVASQFRPGEGIVDETPRPRHHSAMVWFLSNLNSLAQNGWFGYENPEPLIPPENIQMLTNGMGKTTMNAIGPGDVPDMRLAGEFLGAMGWLGTQTNQDDLRQGVVNYASALADRVESNLDGNGRVSDGADNQAATQGFVAQGLVWASQLDGVDRNDVAGDVLGYLDDELWDPDAETYASGSGDSTYTLTARDVGDITGGLNAADAVLGRSGVKERYTRFFDATLNRGGLQRAQRPPSVGNRDEEPPVPPKAGGEFGQASVYNAEVEYDTDAGEWSVTDDTFRTADALYLSNQEVWISNWGGEFYEGRGVPGQTDDPP